jgi:hypothetical protein
LIIVATSRLAQAEPALARQHQRLHFPARLVLCNN